MPRRDNYAFAGDLDDDFEDFDLGDVYQSTPPSEEDDLDDEEDEEEDVDDGLFDDEDDELPEGIEETID